MADFIPAGLAQSPRPVFLYISTEHCSTGWHRWDYAKAEPILVPETGVYGNLVFIEESVKTFKNKDNLKLRFHVYNGPLRFVIESGRYSQFSKGIIGSIHQVGVNHIKRTYCFAPEPGSEDKVVFGNMYDAATGRKVFSDTVIDSDEVQDAMIDSVLDFVKLYERRNPGSTE